MERIEFLTDPAVCSRRIEIGIENGVIKEANVIGGCHGNLQGVCRLVENRSVKEVISLLRGIRCGGKMTSCPDQLAVALEQYCKKKDS